MRISVSTVARSLLLSCFISLPAHPAPDLDVDRVAPGEGTLQAHDPGGVLVSLPLRHTDVRAEVSGFVARVEVTQTFGNPFESAIEATYVFPLPERAAVDDFVLEVGDRRVRGEIRRREEASRIYETARAAGHTASLLHQERPNIFTQSVANIPPGEEVKIHLRYIDLLPFAEGAYRFLYPMVVGPRYSPGHAAPATAHARAAYLRPGFRAGNDISIILDVEAGVPIRSLSSESHQIVVTRPGPTRARVSLASVDRFPNKDLMLRWDVGGEMPELGVLAHRADDDGFFALLIQPKATVTEEEASPKEILFILDQSGSMSGLPIEMSKRFMRLALRTLGPRDRFNIVRFDSSATALASGPLANTEENVRRGLGAVDAMRGSGGTEMLAGFDAALSQPRDTSCVRIVFFLTDGFIGNEEDIFRVIRERRGDARIFTLGIGSSVNHHLLRGMAELGHGSYQYVRPDGHEKEAVERFQRWVTRPYLTDLELDWGGLRVEDVQPSRLPDLYSGQTLSVVGRYLWGGTDTLIVRGRLGGVPWEKQVQVTLPERSEDHAALASVWARQRIHELLMQPGEGAPPQIEAQVVSLALAFRLMSPFTSFVAVDESVVVNPGGDLITVNQQLPMPELASFEGSFGAGGPGRPEALPLPAPTPLPRSTVQGYMRGVEGSAPNGVTLIEGTVRDTSGNALPDVVVELRHGAIGQQSMSESNGRYRIGAVAPADGYVIRIDAPGFAPVEIGPLELEAGRLTTQDILLRTEAELTESVIVYATSDVIEATATSVSPLIISQSTYNVRAIDTDGDGNPNVHGARDTGLQHRLDGSNYVGSVSATFGQNLNEDIIEEMEVISTGANFGRADGGFANIITNSGSGRLSRAGGAQTLVAASPDLPQARGGTLSIERAALRILADLADDGRLSRAEGLPALAGLLEAQYSNGGLSVSVRAQALATWALAEAAASEPRLGWVPDAALKAADFLTGLADDPFAGFVLDLLRERGQSAEWIGPKGMVTLCFDPRRALDRVRGDVAPSDERLIDRILLGRHAPSIRLESR